MAMGNAAMALVYSGEAAYAMELNDDLSYSVPEDQGHHLTDFHRSY